MRIIDADAVCERCRKSGSICTGKDCEIPSAPTLTPPAEDNNVPTKTPNEPLTLEVLTKSQLFQMLGEKVEVIRMGEMCQAEWATVRSFGDCKTDSGRLCCHELYGKTWIAYHRPPEGETNA